MRVFYSPISGFPSAATQMHAALFQTPVEGDAAADFEGLFRSLLTGAQTGAETSQELAAFLSGTLQGCDECASAAPASSDEGQIVSSMRTLLANYLLRTGQTAEPESASRDSVQTTLEEDVGQENLPAWVNPWQWMFPFSFQDILARRPLTGQNTASEVNTLANYLLRTAQTAEPESASRDSVQTTLEEDVEQENLPAWDNPWQWMFPFSFQDILARRPLTDGSAASEETSEAVALQDGTDEPRGYEDPIMAYLASLAPGTPVVLDFSFSLEQQTVVLDGGMDFSSVVSGVMGMSTLSPDGSEYEAVAAGDETSAMSPKGNEASAESGENIPSGTNEKGTVEVDPDRLRGISFYRSFSMSRNLRVLEEFSGNGVASANMPSGGGVAEGKASRESGAQDTTLAGVSPMSSAGVSVIGDETDRLSPKSVKETDSVNPSRLRELAMDVLGAAGRTNGENNGAPAGDKRGHGERNDMADRSEALQRLMGNVDSAIQNGQKNGALSFKSVMKEVLTSGAPLLAQEPAAFSEGVSNVVRFLTVQGESKASIVIEPPALGRVDIELSQTAGGIEASLKVNTEQLRQYIQDQSVLLRNILQQQGVVLTEFSVDVRDMTQRDGSKNEEQRRQARIRGVEDPETAEEVADFRIDLEQGLLYWVA